MRQFPIAGYNPTDGYPTKHENHRQILGTRVIWQAHLQVYDATEWLKLHPGGEMCILNMAGQDATDAFRAFHKPKVCQCFCYVLSSVGKKELAMDQTLIGERIR
jgi:hypothetical protein